VRHRRHRCQPPLLLLLPHPHLLSLLLLLGQQVSCQQQRC
jgi:hypothetical protein